MSKVDDLLEEIGSLTVLEAAELKEKMEEEFGVSASAPVAAAPAGGGAAGGEEEEEEQTAFDVVLTDVGDQKIQVIKAVREVTSLGLKEAKDLVDNAPNPVVEGVDRDEADEVKEKLEEQGASVELQ